MFLFINMLVLRSIEKTLKLVFHHFIKFPAASSEISKESTGGKIVVDGTFDDGLQI